jgi:hypothetical protein
MVALLVGFGMSAVGQGHAQSPARHPAVQGFPYATPWAQSQEVDPAPVRLAAQGRTITRSFTFTGSGEGVGTAGELSFVVILQENLADGSTARESDAGLTHAPGANGCSAETIHGTRTFAAPADTYDLVAVAQVCPVPGHAVQAKASGHATITGGTGRYTGATGTETWTHTCSVLPWKADQQIAFNCSGQGSATITLAGH